MLIYRLLICFKIFFSQNIILEVIYTYTLTVWIKIILLDMIWVQTVHKDYLQMTLAGNESDFDPATLELQQTKIVQSVVSISYVENELCSKF